MSNAIDFHLYVIGNQKLCAPKMLPLVLKQAVQTGVKAVQVREKQMAPRDFYRLCEDVQNSVSQYGTQVFVNDRADIAAAVGAAGVHLTERSVPVPVARRILGDEALIGVSVHSGEGALTAQGGGADFVVFGPVYQSLSHPETAAVGVGQLEQICSLVDIPVFALGGITPDNAKPCLEAGAHGVACIGAVVGAKSLRSAVRAFKRELGEL